MLTLTRWLRPRLRDILTLTNIYGDDINLRPLSALTHTAPRVEGSRWSERREFMKFSETTVRIFGDTALVMYLVISGMAQFKLDNHLNILWVMVDVPRARSAGRSWRARRPESALLRELQCPSRHDHPGLSSRIPASAAAAPFAASTFRGLQSVPVGLGMYSSAVTRQRSWAR